jgi:hypothetical protein
MTSLGGEAYIMFKPGLVDEQGNMSDVGRKALLLQGFVDRFSVLVARLTRRVETQQ